ncbi:MAG TPA: DUF2264 domain-containing protein [Acidobacteriaceae bacterium]|jgi:hypothetical protein
MRRRDLIKLSLASTLPAVLPAAARSQASTGAPSGRATWLRQMRRVAFPVLDALKDRKLKALLPIEAKPGMEASRRHTTHLEAFGRTLCGIAPWLENGTGDATSEEGRLHGQAIETSHAALANAVDPQSPDYLEFGGDRQTLVDAAFLALAILRAPQVLNRKLSSTVRQQLAEALRKTRPLQPAFSNWLLFTAGVEAALFALGEPWDKTRVDYALREHMSWYMGDGIYGDGPHLHADYYNSFVIHPFLLAILEAVGNEDPAWKAMATTVRARSTRYASVQERMIAPDGTYPVVGRSITYRCGAFHLLADAALRHMLPEGLTPEQVRCALAAVIHRTLDAPGTFDAGGWLRIGLSGHQPLLGESYISTGSLYLCTAAFLPLGLPASDRFWSGPDTAWTAKKLWQGDDLPADHAIDG